jgi:hypothetical protein
LRVLLTCLVLATAMPAATAPSREDVGAPIAFVSEALDGIRQVRLHETKARAQVVPTGYTRRETARPQAFPNDLRVQARRAFLLNCSCLC